MMSVVHRRARGALVAAVASVVIAQQTNAQHVWDTAAGPGVTGGTEFWNLSNSNWTTDGGASNTQWDNTTPASAVFGDVGGTVTINSGTGVSAAGLTFNSTGYTIAGQTAADTLTLNATTPPPVIDVVTAGHVATISTRLIGTQGFSKTGAGTLVLSGVNATATPTGLSGGIVVNGGVLRATLGSSLGLSGVTLNNGTALELTNDAATTFSNQAATAVATPITLGASATAGIVVDRATGGAGVTHTLGALTLGSGSTLNVTAGAGVTSGTGGLTFGAATLSGAATINTAANALTTLGTVSMASNLTIDGAGNVNVTGSTTGTGQLIKNGTGTVNFTADPNHSGVTTINGGVLNFNHTGSTDFNATINSGGTLRITGDNRLGDAMTMTINAGGTFDMQGGDTIRAIVGDGVVVANGGNRSLTIGSGSTVATTWNGVAQNGGSNVLTLTKTGSFLITFTNNNTYTGTTTTNTAGLAITGPNGALSGSATVNVGDGNGGGEFMVLGALTDVVTGPLNRINDSATVNLNGSTNGGLTVNGPATGSGGFTETIGSLVTTNGRNIINLAASTGEQVQLTAGTLVRANQGTLLARGAGLGLAGVGGTRLVGTTAPAQIGLNGADGTHFKSIVPWIVGDASLTGAGTGFVTHGPNGIRLLDNATEYASTIAGSTQRNVSSAGGETIVANALINSLRLSGGTTTVLAGQSIFNLSGAHLITGNATLAGPGTIDTITADAIFTAAANTTPITVTLSAQIRGSNGMTLASNGDVANTFILSPSSPNLIAGTIAINNATVRLTNTEALTPRYPAGLAVRPNGLLQLNGNSVVVRNLSIGGGQGVIQNASATPATVTTYVTANQNIAGVGLTDGTGGGALGLIVSGGSQLQISANQTYTGPTEVRTGTLLLNNGTTNANGTINTSSSITVGGATLRLLNNNQNNTNRIGTVPVKMLGGTFDFDNTANTGTSYSEVTGALTLESGTNTLTVDRAASGATSALTFASLTRNPGTVLHLSSQSNGTTVFDLGTTAQSRLVFTAAPTLDDGIIGGWATIDSATGREFAKYVATGTISATSLVAADYTTTLASGSNPTQNVKITATPAALTSDTQINSLNLQQASATSVDVGAGNTLRVESGGIIMSGNRQAVAINNGTLTAGNGTAGGELIVHTLPSTVSALGWANTGDTVSLANAVNGTQIVFSTAPGGLTAGTRYFVVNATATTIQVSAAPGGPAIAITNDGTTAALTELTTPRSIGSVIADNGAAPVAVVKSGNGILSLTAANTYTGKTTINGGIIAISSDGNLGTAPASPAPGHLKLSNGGTLLVGDTMTLNANRLIEVGFGNNNIEVVGGSKTLTYNGSIVSTLYDGAVANTRAEGSLNFLSSNVATNTVAVNLATPLQLGGSLRIDAGTFAIPTGTSTIGRSLQVGTSGTATFTAAAGAVLNIGAGINDTLDVGVNVGDAIGANGTLNLSNALGVNISVDQVRIGRANAGQSGIGNLLLPANADIVAGTTFMVGNTAGAGNNSAASSVAFGSGLTTIVTPNFTIGGDKARGTATIAAGGVLNLQGFGSGTTDLFIGNYLNTGVVTAPANASHLNLTGGSLVGILDEIVVGQKTGGNFGGNSGILTLTGNGNDITANSVTVGRIDGNNATGTSATNGTLNFGGGSLTVLGDVRIGLFTNNSVGTFTTAGTVALTGGTVTINGNVTTSNAAQSTSVLTVNGASVDFTSGNVAVDTFNAQSGTIQNIAQLFGGDGTTPAALTKTTAGTLTILGSSGYTGATAVNAGTLVVNGSLTATASTTVNTGTLKGTGSIANALTVGDGTGAADAILAPGNSVGTITFGGNLAFAADSLYDLEIDSTAATSDLLSSPTGTLTITAGAALDVTDLGSAVLAANTALPFINYNGTLNGGPFSSFGIPGLTDGTLLVDDTTQFTVGSNTFTVDYNYNGGTQVALVAVPEPATAGLLAMAGLGLLARRRRK